MIFRRKPAPASEPEPAPDAYLRAPAPEPLPAHVEYRIVCPGRYGNNPMSTRHVSEYTRYTLKSPEAALAFALHLDQAPTVCGPHTVDTRYVTDWEPVQS